MPETLSPASVHFTRHSAAEYKTYAGITASENPEQAVDRDKQVVPDLSKRGVELAEQKADELLSEFNPEQDALFFVSSDEARALETANIYRLSAKAKGFEVIKPKNVKSKLAKEMGEGEIRTVDNLSLRIKNTLLTMVFTPESRLDAINWNAVGDDIKEKWKQAREIINRHDYGSWGANFFHYSEEIEKIFPEVRSTKTVFETKFQNLLRLVEFAVKKAVEAKIDKKIRVLAFGHENYVGYALDRYFQDHEIKNCETINVTVEDGGVSIEKRGQKAKL